MRSSSSSASRTSDSASDVRPARQLHLGEIQACPAPKEYVLRRVGDRDGLTPEPHRLPRLTRRGQHAGGHSPPPSVRRRLGGGREAAGLLGERGRGLRIGALERGLSEPREEVAVPVAVLGAIARVAQTLLEHLACTRPVSQDRLDVTEHRGCGRAEPYLLTELLKMRPGGGRGFSGPQRCLRSARGGIRGRRGGTRAARGLSGWPARLRSHARVASRTVVVPRTARRTAVASI